MMIEFTQVFWYFRIIPNATAPISVKYVCINLKIRDDSFISIAALEPKFWLKFCSAVERPEWASWHLQPQRFDELQTGLSDIFAEKSASEWSDLLASHDCCVEEILNPDQLDAHPQHIARGMFAEGPALRLPAIEALGTQGTSQNQDMSAGADTRTILLELGYSQHEIESLRERKLIRCG